MNINRAISTGAVVKKWFFLFLFLPISLFAEVERFPTEVQTGDIKLERCGHATVRAYRVFKVAYSAFYRSNCKAQWKMDSAETRLLRFDYVRDVPAHAFAESAMEMLKRNLNLSQNQEKQLKAFHAAYQAVGEGDVYKLLYQKQSGLLLSLNDRVLGRLKDDELARQYMVIWMGEAPFDEGLKRNLLGIP